MLQAGLQGPELLEAGRLGSSPDLADGWVRKEGEEGGRKSRGGRADRTGYRVQRQTPRYRQVTCNKGAKQLREGRRMVSANGQRQPYIHRAKKRTLDPHPMPCTWIMSRGITDLERELGAMQKQAWEEWELERRRTERVRPCSRATQEPTRESSEARRALGGPESEPTVSRVTCPRTALGALECHLGEAVGKGEAQCQALAKILAPPPGWAFTGGWAGTAANAQSSASHPSPPNSRIPGPLEFRRKKKKKQFRDSLT